MSRKNKENVSENVTENVTENVIAQKPIFGGISFDNETILKDFENVQLDTDGNEIVSYKMVVQSLDDEIGNIVITDTQAIIALKGLENVQTVDKWLQYRRGAYLVELMSSRFAIDNDIKSVKKLAEIINLGIESSTCNSLESTARKLGVTFDMNGNLELADELPVLPFYHYSQIISLVEETENGYDRTVLKDFIEKCNITPLTPQSKLKELFKKYKNGQINTTYELPDKLQEKINKENKAKQKADEEKKRAEELQKNTTMYIADKTQNAKTIQDKKVIALDLIASLSDILENISGSLFDENLQKITELQVAIANYNDDEN